MIAHGYAHILPRDAKQQIWGPLGLELNFTEVWPLRMWGRVGVMIY